MARNASVAAREAQPLIDDEAEDILEAGQDSKTLEEARARQDKAIQRNPAIIQFPTWRYCRDGRAQIVNDPLELKELESDGAEWADKPFPAETEFLPGGTRVFAAPVGTVDARGAAARTDRPGPEVALTTALPRNVAGSVPSDQAETRQRQAVVGSVGRRDASPTAGVMAKLQAENQSLRDELAKFKAQAKKAANTNPKTGQDKRAATAKTAEGDARERARKEAEAKARVDAEERAERQSEIVNEAAEREAAEGSEGAAKKKGASRKKK